MTQEKIDLLLNSLPSWWAKESNSNTYQFLLSFAEEFDDFDTEMSNMHDEIFIDTSSGTYLNELGRMFRLARRTGETDTEFRARILAYWPGFSGGGTKPSIADTINRITGVALTDITTVEDFPLKFRTSVDSTINYGDLIGTINDVIWQVKAAGVYPFLTFSISFGNESGTGYEQDKFTVIDYLDIIPVGEFRIFTADLSVADGYDLAG